MEKVHTLIWILLAIGAFVFRMVKKAQETYARESRERPTRPGGAVPSLPTAAFQELLQQMQARNAAPTSTETALPPPPAPGKRTLGGRLMPREKARPARSQERTDIRRPSLEAAATARPRNAPAPLARRSSAMPRASLGASSDVLGPAAVRPAASTSETVRQWLSQPASVRAAFVLSEIFQRKYE